MAISIAEVKKLRDATGAGLMDAKKALTDAEGDYDKAVELLRVAGLAKAAKRADREASNGLVTAKDGAMIQLGAETDFVAKNDQFIDLSERVLAVALESKSENAEALSAQPMDDETVGDVIAHFSAKIGEKLELANAAYFDGQIATYLHRRAADLPPQVGVMVEYEGGSAELAHQVCLQIASMSPQFVSRDDVPADVVENEKRIAEATAKEEGKPERAIPKIIEGRVNGYFKDACLVDQAAIWEDKKTVGSLLDEAGMKVLRFARFSTAN